jgi:hypothetical protein
MLTITHHIRKRPSIGPRTTHGPQSPPWWVHWQHPFKVTREKRKRKETNKKKLQQVIESQTKAKSKITWRRQVSDPLGKGNGSTHPRQNNAQAKSRNHQSKAREPQRAPPAHIQAPPEQMQLPPGRMHANHSMKTEQLHQLNSDRSDQSTPPVRTVCNMWIGPALWPVRPVTSTDQTGVQQSLELAQNPWKSSKLIQQVISSSNFSPLLTLHESSKKCKTFNLKLLK